MKQILETMTQTAFNTYFTNKVHDWGDQIDVYVSHTESEDLEGNKFCDVVMVRMPKQEFTNVDEVLAKNAINQFSDNEYLKKQNDALKENIDTLSDAILDLTEE